MENYNRAFKGVWIPAEVWLHPELSLIEKVILQEIDSLDGDRGCFATNKHFAKFCNCSDKTVSNAIGKLVEMGLVDRVEKNSRRILHARLDNLWASKNYAGVSKNYAGVSKNYSPYNNTINNTTNNTSISKDIETPSPHKELKKTTKPKKYDASRLFDLINEVFPKDETFLECNKTLTRYLELRLSNRGRMEYEAFEILVDELLSMCTPNSKGKTRGDIDPKDLDTKLCVDVIRQSIRGGKNGIYMSFFYPDHYSKTGTSYHPDTSMSNEELSEFDEKNLVSREF